MTTWKPRPEVNLAASQKVISLKMFLDIVKNCIRNIFSNIDNKIQAYEANFKKLQNAIHSRSSVQSLVDVHRLSDMVADHGNFFAFYLS